MLALQDAGGSYYCNSYTSAPGRISLEAGLTGEDGDELEEDANSTVSCESSQQSGDDCGSGNLEASRARLLRRGEQKHLCPITPSGVDSTSEPTNVSSLESTNDVPSRPYFMEHALR